MKELYTKAFALVKAAKTIAIAGHIQPDGDCIGSAIALKIAFEKLGKTVDVFFDAGVSGMSKQFSYLHGYEQIHTLTDAVKENYDLFFIVDLNTVDRLGCFEHLIDNAKKTICVDHHVGFNLKNIDVVISDPMRAASGEMIYEFFKTNNIKITREIADALWTSISTDTGCFLYPSTKPSTHIIAASLIECGADSENINYKLFREYDKRIIKGIREVLHNVKFYAGGKVAIIYLKKKYYLGYNQEERNRFKHYVSDIKGVKISATIGEDINGVCRVGLRSHDRYNVEEVAKTFGGGGHQHAAGLSIRGGWRRARKLVAAELEKLFADENK